MKAKRKIILGLGLTFLLILGAFCASVFYYYSHPAAAKSLIEKTVARATGSSLNIKDLSYSLNPLQVMAKGIIFKPGRDHKGFHLEIPDLKADMDLEGSFGSKVLILKRLKVERFFFRISQDISLPETGDKKKSESSLARALKKLMAFLVFSEIRFEGAEVSGGKIAVQLNDRELRISRISATLNREHLVEISCSVMIQDPSRDMLIIVPRLHISTDRALSVVDPVIGCLVKAKNAMLKTSYGNLENLKVKAKLTYNHRDKKLSFEPIDLGIERITFKQQSETEPITAGMHFTTVGVLNLKEGRLDISHFGLLVGRAGHMASGEQVPGPGTQPADILEIKMKMAARFGAVTGVEINHFEGHFFPAGLLPLIPGDLKPELPPITLSGPVLFHGQMEGLESEQGLKLHCDLNMRFNKNRFSYTKGGVRADGEINGEIRGRARPPDLGVFINIRGTGTVIPEEGMNASSLNMNLNTVARLDLKEGNLKVPRFQLSITDVLDLEGKFNVVSGAQTVAGIEFSEARVFPQRLLSLIPEKIRSGLPPVTLSGAVDFSGKVKGFKEQEKWDLSCDLWTHLQKNRVSYMTGQARALAEISGDIRAVGKFPRVRISASLKGNEVVLLGREGVELKPGAVSLSITGQYPLFHIRNLAIHMPQAKVALGKDTLMVDDIRVQVKKGSVDGEKKAFFLPEIRIDSSLLKNLHLSLKMNEEQAVITLKGEETGLLESAARLNLLPSGWHFSGIDSFQIEGVQKQKGVWSFTSKLDLKELGFENRDSSCMGEKISMSARIDGKIDLNKGSVTAGTFLGVLKGEALYDRFYLDLKSNALSSSAIGTYDISGKSLNLSSFRLRLKDILALEMQGTLSHKTGGEKARISLTMAPTPLKPVFTYLIMEPFQTEKPFLSGMKVGGIVSAHLRLSGTGEDWTVVGQCKLHEGKVTSDHMGVSLRGIDLNLPFWYQKGKAKTYGQPLKGGFSIKTMTLPLLPEQSFDSTFNVGPNFLSVKSPTILRIPGGSVRIGPVEARKIFGPQPCIETSLSMDGVDMGPLLSKIWPQPIKGSVSGKLDPISFEGGDINTQGEIEARVFDGKIVLSDFGATGMLTSAPVFGLSARWSGLRLAIMTEGTAFGKIEGVLRGHMNDLEIAYGQPQKFDLLLETVKTKGVSQKISVKAVDNIARIGGGQTPFMGLAGQFATLFKRFSYKKIGVRATLENDVFRINGTIREGGKEYMVKRGGFSGVNIVNQNPDNRAGFKDMVKRIKRVTAETGGPVIK